MRHAALAHLERLLRQTGDPDDPYQPTREHAYVEGMLLAYERIGVLSSSEADRWRVRLAGAATEWGAEPEPPLPDAVRTAGARYLERLVAGAPRLRRNSTPEERAADAECSSALEALRAVGLLDDREHTEWNRRLFAVQAPWVDDPPPPGEGPWVISIPPETPEEAAEDAAFEAAWAARPKADTTHRVITGSPERHAGLAMIALAVRTARIRIDARQQPARGIIGDNERADARLGGQGTGRFAPALVGKDVIVSARGLDAVQRFAVSFVVFTAGCERNAGHGEKVALVAGVHEARSRHALAGLGDQVRDAVPTSFDAGHTPLRQGRDPDLVQPLPQDELRDLGFEAPRRR
jgi:hypothetical protein